MVPEMFQEQYNKLNDAQKAKFHELLAWSGATALQGVPVPITTYENIFKMIGQMGENPDTPAEPDRNVNHDWNFVPIKRENR